MSSKKVTMQSIADRLGISKNAVSLALNDKPGVSSETRDLVLGLAKKLGYGHVSQNSTNNTIMIFIPEYIKNDSFFYNDMYWSIQSYATQKGYNAIITVIDNDMQNNRQLPSICEQMNFAGIMLIGVFNENYIEYLINRKITVISIDNIYYGHNIKGVVTSNIEGSFIITEKVIEYNHKEIGFIGSYNMTSSIYERWCGFLKAMNKNKIHINSDYVINDDSPLSELFSGPEDMYNRLSKMKKLPTAFVCAGDRIALAVINALKRMGYKIPYDISVVGFDDIELGQFIDPPLTTMKVNRKEIGKCAVNFFLNETEGKNITERIILKPEFVSRESLTFPPIDKNKII